MTYEEERKLNAAKQIGYGVYECVSGGLLAVGHGVLSGVMRTPGARMPFARNMIQSGQESIKKGMEEWKSASR